MFKLLVLVLAVAALIEAKPHRRMQHFKNRPKILGGSPAEQGQFPFLVSLQWPDVQFHFCGGSILTEKVIITAGHCLEGEEASGVAAYAGSVFLDNGGSYYAAKKIIVHPDFDPWYATDDISLLILQDVIPIGDLKQPILLPEGITVNPGDEATATGWGTTKYPDEDSPNQLQYLVSTITDTPTCSKALDDDIRDSQICFGGNGNVGHGLCYGDSGSPLVYDNNGKKHVIGLVSWGNPCAQGDPDVYTRVSYYNQWVKDQIAKN